jgi:hypothetical protein
LPQGSFNGRLVLYASSQELHAIVEPLGDTIGFQAVINMATVATFFYDVVLL